MAKVQRVAIPSAPKVANGGPSYMACVESIERGMQGRSAAMILKSSKDYYNGGTSEMTDAEWDDCVARHLARFGEDLKPRAREATEAPGKKARTADMSHRHPLLFNTLSKSQGLAKLTEWLVKRGGTGSTVVASPKYDGLSIGIDYDAHGKVAAAQTRGDDGAGVDVTSLFAGETHWLDAAMLPGIPFAVKYECCMTWAAVEEMSAALGKEYKNPRNTVAGIAASNDASKKRPFILLAPLEVEYGDSWETISREDRIQRLSEMLGAEASDEPADWGKMVPTPKFGGNPGGLTPWSWVCFELAEDPTEQLENLQDAMMAVRQASDLMIDGAVVEFVSPDKVADLGGPVPNEPDYVTALKFPHVQARTTARLMEFDEGKTGRVTPCVVFDPVKMNGNTYTRTSISSFLRFDEMKLCPGTPLIFELRNDVLGYISRGGDDPAGAVPFPEPEGVIFTRDEDGRRVWAMRGKTMEGRVQHALEKLGVKGVKESRIDKIVGSGLISRIADVLMVSTKQLEVEAGFGPIEARNVVEAISTATFDGVDDFKLLAALGMPGIGRSISRDLLRHVSLDEIAAAFQSGDEAQLSALRARMLEVPGFGEERVGTIMEHMQEGINDLLSLAESTPGIRVTPQGDGEQSAAPDAPKNQVVVVTGALINWPNRDDFKELIESRGHKVTGSISKKTNFLLTNTPDSGTEKNRRAAELGVRVVTEAEFIRIFGLPVSGAQVAAAPGATTPVAPAEVELNAL